MEELLGLLEDIQWYQPMSNSGPSCPCCENMHHWGHEDTCLLMYYIKQLREQGIQGRYAEVPLND